MILTPCLRPWRPHLRHASPIRAVSTFNHNLTRPLQSYISTSNDPYLNLSIEHHLLQKSATHSRVLLLYINRPCVVIGRNQNPWTEVNLSLLRAGLPHHPPLGSPSTASGLGAAAAVDSLQPGKHEAIDLVRRRSGGGTVFHDTGNVNWTIICPTADFTRDKYAEMVVRALKRLGVARARVNERHDIVLDPKPPDPAPNNKASTSGRAVSGIRAVLSRREGDDASSQQQQQQQQSPRPRKVSGSAYKLTRGRALHHGTALLQSPNLGLLSALLQAPGREFAESKGVESVSSPVANVGVCTGDFIAAVQDEFKAMHTAAGAGAGAPTATATAGATDSVIEQQKKLQIMQLGEECRSIDEIAKGVAELQGDEWRYLQTPRFTVSNAKIALSRGIAPLELSVRGGRIEMLKLGDGQGARSLDARDKVVGLQLHQVGDWYKVLSSEEEGSHEQTRRAADWLRTVLPASA